MIVLIIIIRALSINKLPKKTFLVLWGIVLVRLMVPFSISSPFSAYSLVNNNTSVPDKVIGIPTANILPIFNSAKVSSGNLDVVSDSTTVTFPLWAMIWIIGVIICALFFTVAYFKCYREFRVSLPVENDFAKQWLFEHKITRSIQIRQSGKISAPLTYGIFHPVILLPKKINWSSTKELQYILTHEYVHIRRFDVFLKLLLTTALCIHWFNPLVWAMYILTNRDIELFCDETVVRSFGETMKSAYALTLINMEEKKNRLTPLCNNFSKNAIEERITAIMKTKKKSVITIFIAVVFIAGIITIFATSAVSKKSTLFAIPNTDFTEEEYDKLIALQFEGYEDMTISEYREKVLGIIDNTEYLELLDRMGRDAQLQSLRFTNETAFFMYNVVKPITDENWKEAFIFNLAEVGNNNLEYSVWRTILDANKITIGEYEQAINGIVEDMQTCLNEQSADDLADEGLMWEKIQSKCYQLEEQYSNEAVQFAFDFVYQVDSISTEAVLSMENSLKPYLDFGLSFDKETLKIYFAGKEVRGIYDSVLNTLITENVGNSFSVDAIEVIAIYKNGELSGLREATKEEQEEWNKIRDN